jgi:hypothetical protein
LVVHAIMAAQHVYEVRPRKDKRGVDLISDALPSLETYNDLGGEVANFFRVLRRHKKQLVEQIGLTAFSRAQLRWKNTWPLFSYGRFGAGLYPVWIASCSVMYLPVLVVP